MNVALIQNPENYINHQYRHNQQHPQVAERGLEGLGRALEIRADGRGQRLVRHILNARHGVP